jgi:hypothetical protein
MVKTYNHTKEEAMPGKRWLWLALVLPLMLATGCTKQPTSSGDYIVEGQKLMEDQKYTKAAEQFQSAINEDPLNSTALYLHAKAVALSENVNILHCLKYVDMVQQINDTTGQMFDFTRLNYPETDRIYTINGIIKEDLKPIFEGRTHGLYDKNDVMLDYFICNTTYTALAFLDIFPHDGHVDDWNADNSVMNMAKLLSGDPSASDPESLAALIKNDPEMFNDALDAIITNFDDSKEMVAALVAQESGSDMEIDDTLITAALDSLKGTIDFYRYLPNQDQDGDAVDVVNIGVQDGMVWAPIIQVGFDIYLIEDSLGNPITRARVMNERLRPPNGEWLSGDWGVDEEALDGKDNDGDGITDEDFHLPQ